MCEKNLFCFILSSVSREPHFSHTTGSHANLTMQVTQWQIAVQRQLSSETPHDLKTPCSLKPILQVVREKNVFGFIRSSAQAGLYINPQRPLFYKTSFFSCENSLINYFVHSMQKKWSFDGGRHFNFGSLWDWELLLTLKAQIQHGRNENTLSLRH